MSSKELVFCLAEDRIDSEPGLRLAVLSLCRHCPDTPVVVYRPLLDSRFASWASQFGQVTVVNDRPPGANSWNCKPHALIPLLAQGYDQAVWLDSDIVVTRDCRTLLKALNDRVVVVTQEPSSLPRQGTAERTCGWGLEVGRSVPITLNSAVVRVTAQHLPLLNRWKELLAHSDYALAQTLPLEQRPLHMMGDQDVLNALLGARGFEDIPISVLYSGKDIIHTGGALGYSMSERLASVLRPKPTFLHAAAGKPWLWLGGRPYWSKRNFFSWHRRLLQELSPYVREVRQYRSELGEESPWLDYRTATGTILKLMSLGNHAALGLPLTMVATILNGVSRLGDKTQTEGSGATVTQGVSDV